MLLIVPVSPSESSAGNTRGLIEGSGTCARRLRRDSSSAGNTRGLIEGQVGQAVEAEHRSLPRGIPAASLKDRPLRLSRFATAPSSAGNTRGLIEGETPYFCAVRRSEVFRGEYPRPH